MKRSKDRNEPQPPPVGNALVDDAAKRLATIVAAAERAAEQVIDDAEAKARGILDDAEAEAVRIRAEVLAVVSRAARELGGAAVEPQAPSRGPHLSAVPLVEPEQPPAPAAVEPTAAEDLGPAPGSAAGARLLATQMAVSGSSREEIEARLRSGFEIEDTAAILDAILGPGD